ncbi:MAG: oligosaccharide repeat unit polymerase [Gemmatimonadales bacterium]
MTVWLTALAVTLASGVAIGGFVWLGARIDGGARATPFFATVFAIALLDMVGAWLIAIGESGREFKAAEAAHGLPLLLHVVAVNYLFLLGAAAFRRVRFEELHILGERSAAFLTVQRLGMFALGALGTLLLYLYASQLSVIPLIAILFGGEDQGVAAVLRNAATAGFQGHYWRYNVGMAYLLPFVSWYFLCRLIDRSTRGALDWVGAIVFTGLSLFASVVSLQKAPLLTYLVMSFVVFLKASRRRVNWRSLAVLGGLLLVPLPVLYTLFIGATNVSAAESVLLALHRFFGGQIYPALWYLDVFPRQLDFLHGVGLPNPGGFLPFTPVAPAYEVWARIFPDLETAGLHGTANTVYFMEMYANFGIPGMYAIGPIAGAMAMLLSRWVESVRVPYVSVPLTALFMVACVRLALTDFTIFLFDLSLVIAILLMLAVSLAASTAAVALGGADRRPGALTP